MTGEEIVFRYERETIRRAEKYNKNKGIDPSSIAEGVSQNVRKQAVLDICTLLAEKGVIAMKNRVEVESTIGEYLKAYHIPIICSMDSTYSKLSTEFDNFRLALMERAKENL